MSKFTKTIAGVVSAIALVAVATGASAETFSRSLTVGVRGDDVTALQTWLVAKGYLVMPSGVAMGYFGGLTRAAVAAYQTAKGITPAAGYFGPVTRAAVNAEAVVGGSTVPGCTAGAMFSSTTGAPCTSASLPAGCMSTAGYSSVTGQPCSSTTAPVVGGTGITTVGVEGTLTVTSSNAGLPSTIYEGNTMAGVIGMKVEAKNSDIAVQRVKLNLGTDSKIYNKIYKKLYVTDGTNVLASVDLNSSTVVKEGSTYYITITGFNYLVKKDEKKDLVIKADVYSSIDSTDFDTETYVFTVPVDGVRGVDGVGVYQYSPSTTFSRTPTIASSLVDSATLKMSLNTSTPQSSDVVAASGSSENEYDKLPVLAFDLKAEKDNVLLTDLIIKVTKSGTGGATASTTAYLYDGSTELDSASISGDTAVFSDVDLSLVKDVTKTLTVKVDVRNANGTVSQIAATASSTGTSLVAENTQGTSATVSGSATGETVYVRNVGPVFTLVSKAIEKSATASQNNTSTSTAKATFTLKIKAVGGDIMFGTVSSSSPSFGSSTTFFKTYVNGAASTLLAASSTSYDVPSSGVVTSGLTNSFTLQENNEITLPVSFLFEGRTTAGALLSTGSYSIGLEQINWDVGSAQTSTFMAGDTDWRTSTVSLP